MMLHTVIYVFTLTIQLIQSKQILPRDVIPKHYDVEMDIDIKKLSFSGKVCIQITCQIDTQEIKLHGKQKYNHIELEKTIDLISISTNSNPHIQGSEYDRESDILTIRTTSLKEGNGYKLCLRYKGQISEERNYVVWNPTQEVPKRFLPEHREKKLEKIDYIIASNFDRQSAFPCFDEPDLVATFTLQLTTTPTATTFSNVQEKQSVKLKNPIRTHDTYRMQNKLSPSQIAFAITNCFFEEKTFIQYDINYLFKFIKNKWAQSKRKEEVQENMKQIVTMNKLIRIPTTTFLVIPDNKQFISMKVGLVLISESEYTERNEITWKYSVFSKAYSTLFGGVVPMDSLDSTWIFTALTQTFTDVQIRRKPDATKIALPMMELPSTDLYINMIKGMDIFEEQIIGTDKGLLLLQTIHSVLGNAHFISSIKQFIQRFWFGTPVGPQSLWEIFDVPGQFTQSKIVLPSTSSWGAIMKLWTTQPGYPLVTVTAMEGGKYKVTQSNFIGSYNEKWLQDSKDNNNNSLCWVIPLPFSVIDFRHSDRNKPKWNWMECNGEGTIVDTGAKDEQVVLINTLYTSLYRVRYDSATLGKIFKTIPTYRVNVDPVTRARLVHDVFSLAWMGYIQYKDVSMVRLFMEDERNEMVWQAFISGAFNLNEILKFSPDTFKVFQEFVDSSYKRAFYKMFNGVYFKALDPHHAPVTSNKILFLHWACIVGRVETCRNEAQRIFHTWLYCEKPALDFTLQSTNLGRDPSLINIVMCSMLMETRYDLWKAGIDMHFALLKYDHKFGHVHPKYREEFFKVLRCIGDNDAIKRILDWTLQDIPISERATKKEQVMAFIDFTEGPVSYQLTLDYFYNNIDKIMSYHGEERVLASFVKALTSKMSATEVEKMKSFIEAMPNLKKDKILQAFEEGKASAKLRHEWLDENELKLRDGLHENPVS